MHTSRRGITASQLRVGPATIGVHYMPSPTWQGHLIFVWQIHNSIRIQCHQFSTLHKHASPTFEYAIWWVFNYNGSSRLPCFPAIGHRFLSSKLRALQESPQSLRRQSLTYQTIYGYWPVRRNNRARNGVARIAWTAQKLTSLHWMTATDCVKDLHARQAAKQVQAWRCQHTSSLRQPSLRGQQCAWPGVQTCQKNPWPVTQ